MEATHLFFQTQSELFLFFITSPLSPGSFILAAYFTIAKKAKTSFSDKVIFCFWLSCALNLISYFFVILSFYFIKIPLQSIKPILFSMYFFSVFLNPFLFLLYVLARIPYNNLIKWTTGFLAEIVLFITFVFYIKDAKVVLNRGEPLLSFPELRIATYVMAVFILISLLFFIQIIFLDIKNGIITWKNLGPFYFYYALVIYGATIFVQVFYFLPWPSSLIIQFFQLLIPYLVYLSRKDELRNSSK